MENVIFENAKWAVVNIESGFTNSEVALVDAWKLKKWIERLKIAEKKVKDYEGKTKKGTKTK